MKKLFLIVSCLLIPIGLFALSADEAIVNSYDKNQECINVSQKDGIDMDPVYYAQHSTACTFYTIGGGTTTVATYQVFADSIAFVSVGGLYPGTTHFKFFDTDKDTIIELIVYMNEVATTTLGAEGGIVATRTNGSYWGNISSSLTITGATNCHSSTHTIYAAIDNTYGIAYTIPASTSSRRNYLTNLVVNATFASGSTYMTIYDGDTSTSTVIRREKLRITAMDGKLDIDPEHLFGSLNTPLTITLIGSTTVTNAVLNFMGFTK